MAGLDQLSVVILTYQRPIYALRNMHLLDRTGASVHVLDGTTEPIEAARLSRLSERIKYHHLPVSYEERMARALDLVDTPYCVSLSDDDMHLPSGLAASVRALESDAELVAATGTAVAVKVEDGKATGKPVYEGLLGRTVPGDDPVERMIDHLGRYLPSTVYAVTRTPVWKRAAGAVTAKRFPPVRLGELQYEMTVAYAGKTTVVPQLMWLRSFENPAHWRSGEVPLAPWWEQAATSGERDEFAAYMGTALTDDAVRQPAAARGALAAMDTYIQALANETALRESLTPAERQERWPYIPYGPLAECVRRVAAEGVGVNDADVAAATAALESTPSELPPLKPARRTLGLASRLGRRRRG